jgi:D-erythritol 1-phosphate dehydrogenase
MTSPVYDLLVIGGGINGAGIARDAVGRGLSVLLVEQDDLASATSQWSTKLIHGGLRYLEYYEFRLVAEALAEREVMLRIAPHLVEPLAFVLPHEPHLRPAWMIRTGLFLYDHLGGRKSLPSSFGVDLSSGKWSAGLSHRFRKGFVYSDARVDDARLVVVNALDAKARGAEVRVRTKLTGARRQDGMWKATLQSNGTTSAVAARGLVNTAGPWVKEVLDLVRPPKPGEGNVRHVKGSHIVVPRVHGEAHAYILQNADNRIVFVIPYQEHYSLIGTTDIPVESFEHPHISDDEVQYLLDLANAYLDKPLTRDDIVWTYSGVRPLYDDGASDPSAVTRDYVLKVDAVDGAVPVLSSFGGKITTYRKLAEHALRDLRPYFPSMRSEWTASAALPGGDLRNGDRAAWESELRRKYPQVDGAVVHGIARRHGTRATLVLGDAKSMADLGRDFGAGLTQREVDYLVREEWATSAEDVLWRRTKCGLPMTRAQRDAVAEYLQ